MTQLSIPLPKGKYNDAKNDFLHGIWNYLSVINGADPSILLTRNVQGGNSSSTEDLLFHIMNEIATLAIPLKNRLTVFNVKDFGAVGDGVADDTVAIQTAINTLRDAYTSSGTKTSGCVLLFPEGIYKVTAGLTTYRDIELRGQFAELRFATLPAGSVGITIMDTYSSSLGAPRQALSNLLITGIVVNPGAIYPASGDYLNATGILIKTHEISLDSVQLVGWNKAVDFDTNAYIITFFKCSMRSNNYGIYFDATARTNLGERITFLSSNIAGNRQGIYNNLGGLVFIGCSIDYNRVHVAENITRLGGVSSASLQFMGCWIESIEDRIMFTNNGSMIISGGALWFDGLGTFIQNNDELSMVSPELRLGPTTYLVAGNTPRYLPGTHLQSINLPYIHPNLSNFPNANCELVVAGWTSSYGTLVGSTTKAHSGTKSLVQEGLLYNRATHLSPGCRVKGREAQVSVWVDNSGAYDAHWFDVLEYDMSGAQLASTTVNIGKAGSPGFVRINSAWIALNPLTDTIKLNLVGSFATYLVYWDDFYINYR